MSNQAGPENGPPPQSRIEQALALRALTDKGADTFSNESPLWMPPWGRGIFGGAVIAQGLSTAQATVPRSFSVHSMHCHFLQAANNETPIVYQVERVQGGNTLITRTVQAKQKERCIFNATVRFMRESRAKKIIEHSVPIPDDLTPPPEVLEDTSILLKADQTGEDRPCDCVRCPAVRRGRPETRKLRHWIRARGRISDCPLNARTDENEPQQEALTNRSGSNYQAHAMALAYMTDTYFIGTVARVHNASRFTNKRIVDSALAAFRGSEDEAVQRQRFFDNLAREEMDENKDMDENEKLIHMMVTLDHTIFFHNPCTFRADEWMLVEMDTPWAGHERGLVTQRVWSQDGTLIATCVQEGLVRLFQEDQKSRL
jgi:acyl-coenzyme A thioesterase 1/2/4